LWWKLISLATSICPPIIKLEKLPKNEKHTQKSFNHLSLDYIYFSIYKNWTYIEFVILLFFRTICHENRPTYPNCNRAFCCQRITFLNDQYVIIFPIMGIKGGIIFWGALWEELNLYHLVIIFKKISTYLNHPKYLKFYVWIGFVTMNLFEIFILVKCENNDEK